MRSICRPGRSTPRQGTFHFHGTTRIFVGQGCKLVEKGTIGYGPSLGTFQIISEKSPQLKGRCAQTLEPSQVYTLVFHIEHIKEILLRQHSVPIPRISSFSFHMVPACAVLLMKSVDWCNGCVTGSNSSVPHTSHRLVGYITCDNVVAVSGYPRQHTMRSWRHLQFDSIRLKSRHNGWKGNYDERTIMNPELTRVRKDSMESSQMIILRIEICEIWAITWTWKCVKSSCNSNYDSQRKKNIC